MISFKAAGSPIVSRDEANRRAEICSKCKFNVRFPKPCNGYCGELREIVTALVGSERTSYEEKLESCSICGCYLSAAVWMDLGTQIKPLSQEIKNQFESVSWCWKKQSLLKESL